jgi:hypothetical protein
MSTSKSKALKKVGGERTAPKYNRGSGSYSVNEGKTGHYFNNKASASHFHKTGKLLKGEEAR